MPDTCASSSAFKVGDIVLWKKGDGVFLKVTSVWPTGLTGRDANDTVHIANVTEVVLHPPHKAEEVCEMCEGPIDRAMRSPNEERNMHEAFKVHMLTAEGKDKASAIAYEFDRLLTKLQEIVPVGRELSLTTTKLEEACFFAKKGMAQANSRARMGKFSFTIEGIGTHSSAAPEVKHPNDVDAEAVLLLRKLQARGVPITRATFVHHPGGSDELTEEWVGEKARS